MAADPPRGLQCHYFTSAGGGPRMTIDTSELLAGLHSDAVSALVAGRHGDPFAILGPHRDADGRLIVRAFLPGSAGLSIVDRDSGTELAAAQLVHPAGLFAAALPEPRAYGLRVR